MAILPSLLSHHKGQPNGPKADLVAIRIQKSPPKVCATLRYINKKSVSILIKRDGYNLDLLTLHYSTSSLQTIFISLIMQARLVYL